MRKAIEKVVLELEERNVDCVRQMISNPIGSSARTESYGRLCEIVYLTEELKKVMG